MRASEVPIEVQKATYHHGDLPQVLMKLAVHHIGEKGTEKLSLRALAREAGVSATAPYRHFPTKRCLLAALATAGFTRLREEMTARMMQASTLEDRFIAMGLAYLDFAQSYPVHYHLMFGSVLDDFSDYDMLNQAAIDSYAVVDATLEALSRQNGLGQNVAQLGGIVWCSVHGLASLLSDKRSQLGGDVKIPPLLALDAVNADREAALRRLFAPLLSQTPSNV